MPNDLQPPAPDLTLIADAWTETPGNRLATWRDPYGNITLEVYQDPQRTILQIPLASYRAADMAKAILRTPPGMRRPSPRGVPQIDAIRDVLHAIDDYMHLFGHQAGAAATLASMIDLTTQGWTQRPKLEDVAAWLGTDPPSRSG